LNTLPCLSIVILSWNTRPLTLACLRALMRDASSRSREIIVIDNASADKLVRNDENRLYSAGNNQGAELATGEYLCLLNSDTEVVSGALDILVDFLEAHQDYGAVSPKLVSFDHSTQRACTRFPTMLDPLVDSTIFGKFWPGTYIHGRTRMHDFDHESSRDIDQPPGAVFMMRRSEYAVFHGLDPKLSLFYNDVDLCKRLWRKGRRIRYVAEARVYHHQGASTSRSDRVQSLWLENRQAFYAKHYGFVGSAWLRVVRWIWLSQVAGGVVLGPRKVNEKVKALRELSGKVWT
jgi:GT2 family glycosyltransferase